jgi:elongation factor G
MSTGTLKRHSALLNITRDQKERASRLLLMYASIMEDVEELPFGSVGVIQGLKYTRTGDTLVLAQCDVPPEASSLRDIIPPPAVMSASVVPLSHSDLEPVQTALQSLARTDPSVRIDTQEGQILVHGLGALHLEIVEGRLRDEFDARFEFGQRRVSYREGLGFREMLKDPDSNRWFTEIMGRPVFVMIDFSLRSLRDDELGDPAWDGNVVVDKTGTPIRPDVPNVERKEQTYLARGMVTALSSSPHTSLAMSHVHIQVNRFTCPSGVDPSIAASAGAVLLRNRIREVGMGPVMEPYIRIKVTVNEDSLGTVIRDLTEHGGELSQLGADASIATDADEELGPFTQDGVYIPPDAFSTASTSYSTASSATPQLKRTIYAIAPLSRMLDYSSRLRALSGGHGLFEMANDGFRTVSEPRKIEILKEIGRL